MVIEVRFSRCLGTEWNVVLFLYICHGSGGVVTLRGTLKHGPRTRESTETYPWLPAAAASVSLPLRCRRLMSDHSGAHGTLPVDGRRSLPRLPGTVPYLPGVGVARSISRGRREISTHSTWPNFMSPMCCTSPRPRQLRLPNHWGRRTLALSLTES